MGLFYRKWIVVKRFLTINHMIGAMQKALVWLRRDLRLYDNTALSHALKEAKQVWLTFIFDTPSSQRYEKAMSFLGFDPSHLSGEAGHA